LVTYNNGRHCDVKLGYEGDEREELGCRRRERKREEKGKKKRKRGQKKKECGGGSDWV
jgi:hypothetical protein